MNEKNLCPRCKSDYESAGYIVRLIWSSNKEPCHICGRMGWLYDVIDKEGSVRNGKAEKRNRSEAV